MKILLVLATLVSLLMLSSCNQQSSKNKQDFNPTPLLTDDVGEYYVVTNLEIGYGAKPHASAEVRGYPKLKQMRLVESVSHEDAHFSATIHGTLPQTFGETLIALDNTACIGLEHEGDSFTSCNEREQGEISAQHSFGYSRSTGSITTMYECISPNNQCCRPRYSQPVWWSEWQPFNSSTNHSHYKVFGSYTKTWTGSYSGTCQALNGKIICPNKTA